MSERSLGYGRVSDRKLQGTVAELSRMEREASQLEKQRERAERINVAIGETEKVRYRKTCGG